MTIERDGILSEPVRIDGEPPRYEGQGGSNRATVWPEKLAVCMAEPGVWFKVKVGKGGAVNTTASNLRLRKVVVPPGRWEFQTGHDPDYPDEPLSRRAVYAKYLGPEEETVRPPVPAVEVLSAPPAVVDLDNPGPRGHEVIYPMPDPEEIA